MYKTYKQLGIDGKFSEEKKVERAPDAVEIMNLDHKHELMSKNRILCVDIYGKWCEPCRSIAPLYNSLAQRYNHFGYCFLVKENFNLGLSKDFGINGVPTFLIFVDGTLVSETSGPDLNSVEANLKQFINQLPREEPRWNCANGTCSINNPESSNRHPGFNMGNKNFR